jgi:hypothetical protein
MGIDELGQRSLVHAPCSACFRLHIVPLNFFLPADS